MRSVTAHLMRRPGWAERRPDGCQDTISGCVCEVGVCQAGRVPQTHSQVCAGPVQAFEARTERHGRAGASLLSAAAGTCPPQHTRPPPGTAVLLVLRSGDLGRLPRPAHLQTSDQGTYGLRKRVAGLSLDSYVSCRSGPSGGEPAMDSVDEGRAAAPSRIPR